MPDLTLSSRLRSRGLPLVAASSLLCSIALSAADPVADALQQGLLEEEVNRNLPAAIQAYEKAVQSADAQRQTTATALFRLAEGCRRLGRTNDAVAHYRRIVDQFADQSTLAAMSRTNLASLAPGTSAGAEAPSAAPADPAVTALLREELKLVEQEVLIAQKKMENGKADDTEVRRVQRDLLQLQRQLPENLSRDRQVALLQQELAIVEANLGVVRKKIEVGAAPPLDEVAARRELLSVQRELAVAQKAPATPTAPTTSVAVQEPPDSETAEIRRLQALLQDSPDLANAEHRLHQAAREGHVRVAEFLLANGADVNGRDSNGRTPLHYASLGGHKRMCEMLVSRGARVDAPDSNGLTPLHLSSGKGYPTVTEVLLTAGAKTGVNQGADDGSTPLHLAAASGSPSVIKQLIEAGANPSATDQHGRTPLHRLSKNPAATNILEVLLQYHAPLQASDEDGHTALHYALNSGRLDLVQALLEAGANPNTPGWNRGRVPHWPPLVWAANERGGERFAELLLKHGADVESALTNGWTALHGAAYANMQFLAGLLVTNRANVNARGSLPDTGPMWQGSHSQTSVMQGASYPPGSAVFPVEVWVTPLQIAVANFAVDLARYLIDHGADVNAQDGFGRTPLHIAVNRRNLELVKLLLEAKADPNTKDKGGLSALALFPRFVGTTGFLGPNAADPKDLQALLVKYGAQE